ncbi:MAG: hypothetical protein RLZZ301_1365 [Bacteroidota bacterium]|jgi:hypothetical protein
MKQISLFLFSALILWSCGTKVPYTTAIRDEFSLDTEEKMRQIQFYTSHTIILNQIKVASSELTTQNGALVSSSNSESETVIIPAGTRCVFEGFGDNGQVLVRFETGDQRFIPFATKTDGGSVRRYYFDADWSAQGGARVQYGGNAYKVDLTRGAPRSAYLLIVKKKLERTKRKEHIVRGLKV